MTIEPEDSSVQDAMRDWMEAAQRPQPVLTNSELKKVRLLLDQTEKNKWLRNQIKVGLPWIITLLASLSAGWKWIVEAIIGHKL